MVETSLGERGAVRRNHVCKYWDIIEIRRQWAIHPIPHLPHRVSDLDENLTQPTTDSAATVSHVCGGVSGVVGILRHTTDKYLF